MDRYDPCAFGSFSHDRSRCYILHILATMERIYQIRSILFQVIMDSRPQERVPGFLPSYIPNDTWFPHIDKAPPRQFSYEPTLYCRHCFLTLVKPTDLSFLTFIGGFLPIDHGCMPSSHTSVHYCTEPSRNAILVEIHLVLYVTIFTGV